MTQNNGTLTITKATSSLSLTTNRTAPAFGQTVTLTATISPNAVTGTVTFLDGSTVLGTANVVNWVATLPVNSLSVGAHNLSATYSGDSSYLASPAGSVAVTVAKGSGNPVVAATPSQPGFGQPVTITATLSGSPTGSVILTDGSTQVGTATLTNGVATFTLSNLSVGAHTLTATYAGDSLYNSGSGSLSLTVGKALPTVAITSSPSPVAFGQALTLTAAITSTGSGTPTGTVTFSEGSTVLGSGTLSAGSGSFTLSSLTVGSHNITAAYSGDASFNSNSASSSISITKASTTLMLGSNVLNPVFGQAVTIAANVNTASGSPSGTVSLSDGSTSLGTMNLVSGAASFNLSNLAVGSHSLVATYSGDGSYGASSATLTLNVTKATVALNLNPSPASPAFGQTLTITGTLTGSGGTPSGTLAFSEGGNPLGTAILASGAATVNLSSLAVGSHNLIAIYSGDGSFNTNSATLTINVGKAGTTYRYRGHPTPRPLGRPCNLPRRSASPTGRPRALSSSATGRLSWAPLRLRRAAPS